MPLPCTPRFTGRGPGTPPFKDGGGTVRQSWGEWEPALSAWLGRALLLPRSRYLFPSFLLSSAKGGSPDGSGEARMWGGSTRGGA